MEARATTVKSPFEHPFEAVGYASEGHCNVWENFEECVSDLSDEALEVLGTSLELL